MSGRERGPSVLLLRSHGCVNFSLRFQRKLFSTEAAYNFPLPLPSSYLFLPSRLFSSLLPFNCPLLAPSGCFSPLAQFQLAWLKINKHDAVFVPSPLPCLGLTLPPSLYRSTSSSLPLSFFPPAPAIAISLCWGS